MDAKILVKVICCYFGKNQTPFLLKKEGFDSLIGDIDYVVSEMRLKGFTAVLKPKGYVFYNTAFKNVRTAELCN